jgi:carboxypeptidase PM20D1
LKKFFKYVGIIILLLVIFILTRTFLFTSKQTNAELLKTVVPIDDNVSTRLSEAIKFQTVSQDEEGKFEDSSALRQFENFLRTSFPLTDSLLQKEVINGFSLLYTWKGSDPSLKPLILTAHMDVVPAGEEKDWTAPPFSGLIKDGFIWGRGSLDDKGSVMGVMESVEMLLRENFHPKRTVLLAFGHDEEVGGQNGAVQIADYLKKKNVSAEMLVDEGMVITKNIVPGIEKPVALIGVSEKGYVSLQLSVDFAGGHSSMPGKETSIGILSKAISRLQDHPFPARISEPVNLFLNRVGPQMPFFSKMAFANRWLFESVIIHKYEKSNSGNATVRTTTAPTIFRAGVKDNVLPSSATAIINFRILPGETVESVKQYVIKIIDDERVKVSQNGHAQEPSPVSPSDNNAFTTLEKTIQQIFPEIITAPTLMVGASDSRHYTAVCQNIYRFLPVQFESEDLERIHGNNERISVEAYKNSIRFYRQLILNMDK